MDRVVLDQRLEQLDDRSGLLLRGRAEVDVVVVEPTKLSERLGALGSHSDPTGLARSLDHRGDERAELVAAALATPRADDLWQRQGSDDSRRHRVFEVVAHVGDAVGPTDHLTLGRERRGSRPRVVADAVERFGAQVERLQGDVGTPHRMIEAAGNIRRERVFAGVSAGAVAAIVAESDCLGEGGVQSERACDRGGYLSDFEGVREASALMVVGEDEHLGLAGQTPEGAGMQDAVAIAFEARAPRIGRLIDCPVASADGAGGQRRKRLALQRFALMT